MAVNAVFSIRHLLQAPATQQEPLTQMDVKKNVQLEQIKKKTTII